MARVLFSGYYGSGNTGDEAILAALLGTVRRLKPALEPVVLSADPAATHADHGVAAVPHFSLAALRGELAQAQLLISGGGSLLQDTTSWRSPLYYLGVIWLAQRAGLKTAALCQGLGPLRRGWLRRLTARLFCRLDLIALRDQESADFLVGLGLPAAKVQLTADAVWLLDPAPMEQIDQLLQAKGLLSLPRPLVGVFLRPLPDYPPTAPLWGALAAGLDQALARLGGSALFIPMQPPGDAATAQQVMAQMRAPAHLLTGRYSPAELLGLTGTLDLIVGMRLHGLIFAAQQAVPAAGLPYDPKVAAFLAQAGLPNLPLTAPEPAAFAEILAQLWQARDSHVIRLTGLRDERRQAALQAVTAALNLLK